MCRSHLQQAEKAPKREQTNLVEVKEASPDDFEVYGMYALRSKANHPIELEVTLNGAKTTMELDTGASRSIISETTYRKLWKEPPVLEPSTVQLQTYTGEKLEVLGQIRAQLVHQSQQGQGTLLVIQGNGPSLVGRDWLGKMRLDWGEIHRLQTPVGLDEILQRRAAVFREGLGTLKGMEVSLHVDQEARPRFFKPRSVLFVLRDKVECELGRLESEGIIEPVQFSQWAAPIVPVLKADGTIRICGDYKTTVNQVAEIESYPLPKIDELFANLAGGKCFSKLDLSHAYQQLRLDDKSKKYVVIKAFQIYPSSLWSGISTSHLSAHDGVAVTGNIYIDDILVSGKSEEEHLRRLELVLQRLEEAGLRLKRGKCSFVMPSVEYLGHRIDSEGLHPTDEKVRAIKDAPAPRNITELRSFLGLINYYGKFLPQLSTVLAPMYSLLKKGAGWAWETPQAQAFEKAKTLLQESPVLVHYDNSKEIILACDASPYGIGAVISHRLPDGSEKPIAYASSSLSVAEKKYSQLEKEALAIIFGIKKFHQYLFGLRFTIYTDHQPLKHLFNEARPVPVIASSRIQRWARLPLPETLGAAPVPADVVLVLGQIESTTVKAAQIKSWTERDPALAIVKKFCMTSWPSATQDEQLRPYVQRQTEISIQDGCLFWGSRVVIPAKGRQQVLSILQDTPRSQPDEEFGSWLCVVAKAGPSH